jgi:RNA polymerase sigma-54 factor
MRFTTWSSRALVNVTLWVERINFMAAKMQPAAGKIQFFRLNLKLIQRKSCQFRLVLGKSALSCADGFTDYNYRSGSRNHMVLAPQLQQSLALLQAPTLELKALVEQELQQNPVLEEVAEQEIELPDRRSRTSATPATPPPQPDPAERAEDAPADSDFDKTDAAPVRRFSGGIRQARATGPGMARPFFAVERPIRQSTEDEEKRQFMFDSLTAGTSLAQTLMDQVRESGLTEEQRGIAELIIGNIDDFGYLKATVEELSASNNLPPEKISEVLKVHSNFRSAASARSICANASCCSSNAPASRNRLEYRIVRDFMEALGKRRIPEIARGTSHTVEEVQQSLAPQSGASSRGPDAPFCRTPSNIILPEVFREKIGDDFVVTTNDEHIPHLRISNVYKDLMSQGENNAEVKNYIREKIRAGKFLIKSLHQRQQTILNIGREIVKRQRDFMEKGVAHLKPMTMSQVADVVGVHETTVSRAVSAKYMETPQGIFEMKFFFTAGLQNGTGEGVSNTSVKDMVAEIFKAEDASRPLSDQEVVKMLGDKGINIARRTVAKYRGELNILPSNLRKVY